MLSTFPGGICPTHSLTCFVLQVPYLERAVVAARHHFGVVLHELCCHHLVGVASQCVLKVREEGEGQSALKVRKGRRGSKCTKG